MVERIVRIIRLDFSVFKEIEADPDATAEAAIIVAITSVLSALGPAIRSSTFLRVFVGGLASGLIGWLVWAAVAYLVGKTLFESRGTLDNMLRVLGYANAPRFLGILAVIPCIGWLGPLAGAIMALVAGVMAVSEGLDLDTGQAIIVAVVGWIALAVVTMVIGIVLGVGALGLAALVGSFS